MTNTLPTNLESTNGTFPIESHVFLIEDGVPLPPRPAYQLKGVAAALKQLSIGQSFFVATDKYTLVTQRLAASGRTIALRNKDGRKFSTRKVPGGVRVWRTA